jgi:OmpA-OmpF porin, OOP family
VGTAETNQQLSEDRARAVAAALTARGVAASRLSARGHGQSSPLADNRTEEGRAKNRRVELVKQ